MNEFLLTLLGLSLGCFPLLDQIPHVYFLGPLSIHPSGHITLSYISPLVYEIALDKVINEVLIVRL